MLTQYMTCRGTYDLSAALYEKAADRIGKPSFNRALDFVAEVEVLCELRNPEAAAITLATALDIARNPR